MYLTILLQFLRHVLYRKSLTFVLFILNTQIYSELPIFFCSLVRRITTRSLKFNLGVTNMDGEYSFIYIGLARMGCGESPECDAIKAKKKQKKTLLCYEH